MKYVSTRGTAPTLEFDDVLLTGLARDGGLYLPDSWPVFSRNEIASFAGLGYAALAERIIRPFVAGSVVEDSLAELTRETYAGFGHPAVAPLKQLDGNLWLLELFHGPTLAFKDYALQLVGRLFDRVLKARNQRVTIVGATSGDTGSAALAACRDKAQIEIFILHPQGRVSEVQRRQMTTVESGNAHNIAIEGTFDDCQDLVKALFNDIAFRDEVNLAAVNSINWARVMAQIVYYFAAAVALGSPHRPVSFAVPTGNFGNVLAGYAARQMGLPIERLVVGSNVNDILPRFFESGRMAMAPVHASLSPSMDIQVSSNFERLLFELYGRDGAAVTRSLEEFRANGAYEVGGNAWQESQSLFSGYRLDDDETLAEIDRLHAATGELVDPHSAIGVAAGRQAAAAAGSSPMIVLATAHPAKFPDAVERATGRRPEPPAQLAGIFDKPERFASLASDLEVLKREVRAQVGERSMA